MHCGSCGDKKACACGMKNLSCIGKCLYAVPMIVFGIFHFAAGQDMTAILAGWPAPLFWVYLSGAGMILAGVAIIINRYARLASLLLAAEIALIVLILQVPMLLQGGEGAQMATINVLKDLALIGTALLIAGSSTNRGLDAK